MNLSRNNIDIDGVVHLAKALEINTTLHTIVLAGNPGYNSKIGQTLDETAILAHAKMSTADSNDGCPAELQPDVISILNNWLNIHIQNEIDHEISNALKSPRRGLNPSIKTKHTSFSDSSKLKESTHIDINPNIFESKDIYNNFDFTFMNDNLSMKAVKSYETDDLDLGSRDWQDESHDSESLRGQSKFFSASHIPMLNGSHDDDYDAPPSKSKAFYNLSNQIDELLLEHKKRNDVESDNFEYAIPLPQFDINEYKEIHNENGNLSGNRFLSDDL
jgi:hypothetical protein